MKLNSNLDMNNCKIVRVIIDSVTDFPTEDLEAGRIIYHEINQKYYYYNGLDWVEMSSGSEVNIATFPGYVYNNGSTDNDKQITSYSIATESEASFGTAAEELSNSNNLVTAKQVASTIKNLIYFLNPTSYASGGHAGFIIVDSSGNLTFHDTTSVANIYKYMDATKDKNSVLKINADGTVASFPFIIDNAWSKISSTDVWSDVIPTSGCVVNNIKQIASHILENRTSTSVKSLLGIDTSDNGLYLYDTTANSITIDDERILTSSQGEYLQASRKIVDSIYETDYSYWLSQNGTVPALEECIPTVGAIKDALANIEMNSGSNSSGSSSSSSSSDDSSVTPFIIDSEEKLANWLSNSLEPGTDVSSVYIKAGNYFINDNTGVLDMDVLGTHKIYAEAETFIDINMQLYTSIFRIAESVFSEYDFSMEGIHFVINGLNATNPIDAHLMENLKNITNCSITIPDGVVLATDGIFKNCHNISNCVIFVNNLISFVSNPDARFVVFDTCQNLNNITIDNTVQINSSGYAYNDSYYYYMINNCENVQNINVRNFTLNFIGMAIYFGPTDLAIINNSRNISNVNVENYSVTGNTGILNSIYPKEEAIKLTTICNSYNLSNIYLRNVLFEDFTSNLRFFAITDCQNISNCNFDEVVLMNENVLYNSDVSTQWAAINESARISGCSNAANFAKFYQCRNILMSKGYFTTCYSTDIESGDINMIEARYTAANTPDGGFNLIIS